MLTVQQLRVVCVAEVRGLRMQGQENLKAKHVRHGAR